MKAKLNEKKDMLILEIPFDNRGELSKSGKSMTHASTRGNMAISLDDKQFQIGINCFSKIG